MFDFNVAGAMLSDEWMGATPLGRVWLSRICDFRDTRRVDACLQWQALDAAIPALLPVTLSRDSDILEQLRQLLRRFSDRPQRRTVLPSDWVKEAAHFARRCWRLIANRLDRHPSEGELFNEPSCCLLERPVAGGRVHGRGIGHPFGLGRGTGVQVANLRQF
jgi:hypothetical protein